MKVLLIRRENVCNGSLDSFLDGIRDGFEASGAKTGILDVSNDPTHIPSEEKIRELSDSNYDAVLTFNSVGQQNYMIDNVNLWDAMGIPFINYIVDHPVHHKNAMTEHGDNYYVICIDKNHLEYNKKFNPTIKETYFIPLGGINFGDYNEIYSEEGYFSRSIDFLFTGTYLPLSTIEDKINEYPKPVKKLIYRHIEYMLDHRNTSEEEGLIHILSDMGIDPEKVELQNYIFATRLTEEFVKTYLREEMIRYLIDAGLNIKIYGNGWDRFDADMKNTICYPGVAYDDMKSLYLSSKVILNHSSHFKQGMHDRIPSAMLAGAAVLTDNNPYIDTLFKEGLSEGELCTYNVSSPQLVPDIAKGMFSDPHMLYEMTLRANKKARAELTWDCRAREILDIIKTIKEQRL